MVSVWFLTPCRVPPSKGLQAVNTLDAPELLHGLAFWFVSKLTILALQSPPPWFYPLGTLCSSQPGFRNSHDSNRIAEESLDPLSVGSGLPALRLLFVQNSYFVKVHFGDSSFHNLDVPTIQPVIIT